MNTLIQFVNGLTFDQFVVVMIVLIVVVLSVMITLLINHRHHYYSINNRRDQWGLLLDQIDNDPTRSVDRVYSTDTRLFQRRDSKGDPQILKN